MKNKMYGLGMSVILSLVLLTPSLLLAGDNAAKPSKAEVVQKTQNLRMPFIANEGQVDDQVRYYAKTFSGTVYVTRDGGIMYALPKYEETAKEDRNGRREQGRRGAGVRGGLLSCLYNVENMSTLDAVNALIQSCNINQRNVGLSATSPSTVSTVGWVERSETQQGHNPSNHVDGQYQDVFTNPKSAIQNPKSRLVVLKESLIGAKISEIQGEGESATRVSYFKGNDPSQWKSNIATYNYANLGEVYEGITLKLKAHGNNVEKLFTVKPGANPDQIKISLSGVKECGVRSEELKIRNPKSEIRIPKLQINNAGELVAETGLGPVTFTRPVAYQEIDGKRVEVACEYAIAECGVRNAEWVKNLEFGFWNLDCFPYFAFSIPESTTSDFRNPKSAIQNPKSEYGFKVASYDTTKDLIIDPLLASTFLGGGVLILAMELPWMRATMSL